MNPSDSLHLDEQLARLLAAYDQGIGGGDGFAATIGVPPEELVVAIPGERIVEPLSGGAVNQGSLTDLLPDSKSTGPNDSQPRLAATNGFSGTHRIGRFELRKQLGKGGCGIVFLAYDPKLKREVAVKIPRPELLLSTDARRRLLREATAAAGFDHPNLVPVYETGEIGPVCFIATVFCPGQTLAEWLERQSFPVPIRQAARLVALLAEAVQHAHDRGVLHRDLKPNNVILQDIKSDPNVNGVAPGGQPPGACPLRGDHFIPRVVDFGLAKLTESGPSETATRQILGTPKYMAPEQAQARHEDVGPEADVYALGVILYEMLAGRTPYEGASDVEVLRQTIEGDLTHPRSIRKEIPRDLEAICVKAMARTPARRFRTAIDLADDLHRFLEGLPTIARPLNGIGRVARWLRRNDQAVALGVVSTIAFILLTVGSWSVYQTRILRAANDENKTRDAERVRLDGQRSYARHVRDAFLSWRAGDAKQMTESLAEAKLYSGGSGEIPEFCWGYLSQLGRVERSSIQCPAGPAVALAAAPSGAWNATGHADGTLAIWDRQTGALVGSIKAHANGVTHVAFLDEGSRVVTAGEGATALTWTLAPNGSPKAGASLPPLGAAISALTVSAEGKHVGVGSTAGECMLWESRGARIEKRWTATAGEPVRAIAIAPDGKTAATVGRTEPVRLWQAAKDEPPDEVPGAVGAAVLAFVRTERGDWLLAAAGDDGMVRLFDRQRREIRALPGHTGLVLSLAVNADGTALASAGDDDGVCVWDVATGSMRMLLRGHDRAVRGVGFAPDGKTLFTSADDGLMKAWDLTADPDGQTLRGLPAGVTSLAMRPEEQGHAVAYADGSVEIFAARGGSPRRIAPEGRGPISALRFPETGPPLGVEISGRTAIVWEFGDAVRAVLRAELRDAATAIDLSLPVNSLAVGDDRGNVTIWSLADRAPKSQFATGLAAPVRHLSFSDNGRWIATETGGHAVGVWNVDRQVMQYSVPGHGDGTWLLRFLANDRVITAGRGSSIKVWNLVAGKEERSLLGHVGRVTGLAVSPDLRTLASGSATGEVKLWDMRTGQELIGLRRHSGPVTAAEFSADGRLLITGGTATGSRGELAFWDTLKE